MYTLLTSTWAGSDELVHYGSGQLQGCEWHGHAWPATQFNEEFMQCSPLPAPWSQAANMIDVAALLLHSACGCQAVCITPWESS